ncbi:transglutaminase family protein [Roseomonas elaeocarpi]|uniref:Transglutaminase N-terminal domain-containing protein n=1 Tax=Roseomonas elaeocarpi TaxID=907779 RepID=A0ABV6JWH6_9PROT
MPPIVALSHRTLYQYARPVSLGPQTVRLRPAPHARTAVLGYSLMVSPHPRSIHWLRDPAGNALARVLMGHPVDSFGLTVDLSLDLTPFNPFDFFLEPEAARWPFRYPAMLEAMLAPYRQDGPPSPAVAALLLEFGRGASGTVEVLVAANTLVNRRVAYIQRAEPGIWSPEETLEAEQGSCRDSAWLMVGLLRALGFAARFCSGYLVQLADENGGDRADLHAWAEAWLPGAGWIGLDATSGLLTAEGHVPLAAAPAPDAAMAVTGWLEPVESRFSFEMEVSRLDRGTMTASEAK